VDVVVLASDEGVKGLFRVCFYFTDGVFYDEIKSVIMYVCKSVTHLLLLFADVMYVKPFCLYLMFHF
jgi:hypothetical protein